MARISLADAALQLQVHFFAASRIFLAEDLGIDRRLLVHRLVISLENRAFAEAVAGGELDAIGKGRQRRFVALAFDKAICDPEYNGQAKCVRTGRKGSIFVQSNSTN